MLWILLAFGNQSIHLSCAHYPLAFEQLERLNFLNPAQVHRIEDQFDRFPGGETGEFPHSSDGVNAVRHHGDHPRTSTDSGRRRTKVTTTDKQRLVNEAHGWANTNRRTQNHKREQHLLVERITDKRKRGTSANRTEHVVERQTCCVSQMPFGPPGRT